MARIIKRYENRKLYDTEESAYVSQADVARLVRQGETVKVVDNASGEDMTAQILTQIILEEGKEGDALLPTDLLHDLLRKGGKAAAVGIEHLRGSVDELVNQSINRLSHLISQQQKSGVNALRDQIDELEEKLDQIQQAVREEDKQNAGK